MVTLHCIRCQAWVVHYVTTSATSCQCRQCGGYTPHFVEGAHMTADDIEKLIREEYSGDRNPRPDLLAKKIVERKVD